jgi:alkylation response protein AidB-like acyl-CoA dehydrogenase
MRLGLAAKEGMHRLSCHWYSPDVVGEGTLWLPKEVRVAAYAGTEGLTPFRRDLTPWVDQHGPSLEPWAERAASIYGGTAEIQRKIVADQLLGLRGL